MFQTCPVKIMTTAANSNPAWLEGKRAVIARTSPGIKPKTGMLCRTSSRGIRTRSAVGSLAAQ
jgi:hypothetical protein